jgi:tRNA/tmRNA/rRNA uracil-C5-methylase (TrmA/RlmC/RlmD family)
VARVQSEARRLAIVPYDETTGTGQFRHVLVSVQRHTQQVQLTLVWNTAAASSSSGNNDDETLHPAYKLCRALLVQTPPDHESDTETTTTTTTTTTKSVQWHSIWLHGNAEWKHSNAIVSHTGSWKQLYSSDGGGCRDPSKQKQGQGTTKTPTTTKIPGMLTEYLGPLLSNDETNINKHNTTSPSKNSCTEIQFPLHFPPQVFRQANLTAFTAIVQSIRRYMLGSYYNNDSSRQSQHPRCLELYGGVGTIGLHVADLCRSLVCSDENPYNQACFEASADSLLQQLRKRQGNNHHIPTIRYESLSAAQMVTRDRTLHDVDVVIVDPPRKGLERSVCAALAATANNPASSLRLLIYVSCGFAAFQRDYQMLCPNWRLQHAEGHILFPGSNAIETLAFFARS